VTAAEARKLAAHFQGIADIYRLEAERLAGGPLKPRVAVRLRKTPEPTGDVSAAAEARAALVAAGVLRR
jgi:hypothetical protein